MTTSTTTHHHHRQLQKDNNNNNNNNNKQQKKKKKKKKNNQLLGNKVTRHPQYLHGLVIDAGSTGSRLHVYEFQPRLFVLSDDASNTTNSNKDEEEPLLTVPTTHSRWTDRLSPGISTFSNITVTEDDDDELRMALKDYLEPLLEFAKYVLRSKKDRFEQFPIYLKATGGMRALPSLDRQRIMTVVRDLFHDKEFCPFDFVDERARTISGEEEAVYGWAAVNFLMGTMLKDASQGTGAVRNPAMTYGALDMGGASTQISFFEPHEDVMANLFKLQVGGERHWNIYAHSFLYFGVVYAEARLGALIASDYTGSSLNNIPHPCLPRGQTLNLETDVSIIQDGDLQYEIHLNETYSIDFVGMSNYDKCSSLSRLLLRKEVNREWCNFSHRGDCSFSGVYQPPLPTQQTDKQFGEFLGFSNFYHVWNFLKLNEKSTLSQLQSASQHICGLSYDELKEFNGKRNLPFMDRYCFRSVYVFELLHIGYGFGMEDSITCKTTLNGQKVGWALGAFLYEVNTLPWQYISGGPVTVVNDLNPIMLYISCFLTLACMYLGLVVCSQKQSINYRGGIFSGNEIDRGSGRYGAV